MDQIIYQVVRSDRRTTAIQILPEGKVLVRCPRFLSQSSVEQLLKSKESWIRKKLQQLPRQIPRLSQSQLRDLAKQASEVISHRVADYAVRMGVTYGRIAIRRQKTRWGSCSTKGNLNFNCLLVLAPAEVMDYVVVHELSHRLHMDHSPAFWDTVQRYMPDYVRWRQWLKEHGTELLAQLP